MSTTLRIRQSPSGPFEEFVIPDGGSCPPLSDMFYVDAGTEVAEEDQDGSICAPFATLSQVATLISDPDWAGWWVVVQCAPGTYSGAFFEENGAQLIEIFGNGAWLNGTITVGAHQVVTLDQFGFTTGGGVVYESDTGTATFISCRDCFCLNPASPNFTISPGDQDTGLCHAWIAGTWSNVARDGFHTGGYGSIGNVEVSGDLQITNYDCVGSAYTGRKISTANGTYFSAAAVTLTATEDIGESSDTLIISRDTWFAGDVTAVRATGSADGLWGVDAETQFSLDLRTVVLTDFELVLESAGGGGTVAPLTEVLYVDAGTAVATPLQNGSIAAPYKDPQAAVDAIAQFGTIVLIDGAYDLTPIVLTNKSLNFEGFGQAGLPMSLNISGTGSDVELVGLSGVDVVTDAGLTVRACYVDAAEGTAFVGYDSNLAGLLFSNLGRLYNCTTLQPVQFTRVHAVGTTFGDSLILTEDGSESFLYSCRFSSAITIAGPSGPGESQRLVVDAATYASMLENGVTLVDVVISIADGPPTFADLGSIGGAQNLNFKLGKQQALTVTSNLTLTPTGIDVENPWGVLLRITQGGAGGFTIAGVGIEWAGGGTPPVLTAAVGAVDLLRFVLIDGVVYGALAMPDCS